MPEPDAARLIEEHGVVELVETYPGSGAGLHLRLGNGQVLGYWGDHEDWPSYWVLLDDDRKCPSLATGEHWWLRLLDRGRRCYLCGKRGAPDA